ncbi:hypothetical protein LCGC14_2700680 [marine sediment metagenome]|uniref:Uncharacterized protein n=1 Tax=marine sediment metagenome TaxID=412755 RepID=A0A0F8ZFW9_9ZZZZ
MRKIRLPIIVRLWRILRMTLGVIFSRQELWTIVVAGDTEDALVAARKVCPFPNALLGITVKRLPGLRNRWRVEFIYKGQAG